MPGTPEEYFTDSTTREAEKMIDEMITQGETGGSIIDALETAGLRIYNSSDIEEYEEESEEPRMSAEDPGPAPGEMGLDGEDEEDEEDEYDGGPMYDEELASSGPGPSMAGGNENGNRDLIIEAVRFGVDEDKKKKSKSKKFE